MATTTLYSHDGRPAERHGRWPRSPTPRRRQAGTSRWRSGRVTSPSPLCAATPSCWPGRVCLVTPVSSAVFAAGNGPMEARSRTLVALGAGAGRSGRQAVHGVDGGARRHRGLQLAGIAEQRLEEVSGPRERVPCVELYRPAHCALSSVTAHPIGRVDRAQPAGGFPV